MTDEPKLKRPDWVTTYTFRPTPRVVRLVKLEMRRRRRVTRTAVINDALIEKLEHLETKAA